MISKGQRWFRTPTCSLTGISIPLGETAVAYVLAIPSGKAGHGDGRPVTGPVRLRVGSPAQDMAVPAFGGAPLAGAGLGEGGPADLVHALSRGRRIEGADAVGERVSGGLWWASEEAYEAVRDAPSLAGGGGLHLAGATRLMEAALAWRASAGRHRPVTAAFSLTPLGQARPAPRVTLGVGPAEAARHPLLAVAGTAAPEGAGLSVQAVVSAVLAEVATVRLPGPHQDRWGQGAAVAAEILRMDDVLRELGRGWGRPPAPPAPCPQGAEAVLAEIVGPFAAQAMGASPSGRVH